MGGGIRNQREGKVNPRTNVALIEKLTQQEKPPRRREHAVFKGGRGLPSRGV